MSLRALVVVLGFVAAAFSGTPAPARGVPTQSFPGRNMPSASSIVLAQNGIPAGLVFGGRPPVPAAAVSIVPSTADTITLTNQSGAAIANYPLQFGRPFLQGAIATAPQVVAGGTALATQADVKNR